MSVAGDIIDDLKFAPADKARVLTGLSGVFLVSMFVVIGVFGTPESAAQTIHQVSGVSLQKVASSFSGGVQ